MYGSSSNGCGCGFGSGRADTRTLPTLFILALHRILTSILNVFFRAETRFSPIRTTGPPF